MEDIFELMCDSMDQYRKAKKAFRDECDDWKHVGLQEQADLRVEMNKSKEEAKNALDSYILKTVVIAQQSILVNQIKKSSS